MKNTMKRAHEIARTLEGNYSVRLSIALTMAHNERIMRNRVDYLRSDSNYFRDKNVMSEIQEIDRWFKFHNTEFYSSWDKFVNQYKNVA